MSILLFPVATDDENALVDSASLADELEALGNSTDNAAYLKFTKQGDWIFGRDEDEVDPDELVAVNPASFVAGWQGWDNGSPVDGPVVPIQMRASLPAKSTLEAIPPGEGQGWNAILGVDFKSIEDGVDLQFHTSSYGGKKFCKALMKAVSAGMKAHPDAPVMLVTLGGSSYKHKSYGKIFEPTFKAVGWAGVDGKPVKKLAVK